MQPSSGTNTIDKNGNQLVSRENQSESREDRPVLEEERFISEKLQPSHTFKLLNDSGLEGGIAFIYDWRKTNATLSNNEIITQAANGILVEGGQLDNHREAEYIAKRLLDMKDKSEIEILKRCIYLYSLESFLYKLVNTVLRENDKSKMNTVAPFCYFLTEAIWSDTLAHERFYGIVYRGASMPSDTIHYYNEAIGTHKCWYGFTSTSKSRGVAEDFGNVMFIIDVTSTGGLNVSSYSEYQNEDEVILPPGTIFRIDKVVQNDAKTYIYLFAIPEFRVVLLGRTGSGKSSFGNTILGRKQFAALKTAKSVTKKCGPSDRIFDDLRLLVVDTPGFFDTELSPAELLPEIYGSYQVAAPGPHAFLVVFTLDRFTLQEHIVAKWICEVFDERALEYCIIIFTGLDGLVRNNLTVEEFLEDIPEFLKTLIQKCNGRYIAVDNTGSDDKKEETAKILLEKISAMVKKNGGQFYNNKSFIEISAILKKYPDWFDPVNSDGSVNLLDETAKIVGPKLAAKAIFNNQ
ncbi:unnamed protein product [Rotaria magnacalcarata]|uniref:NAD(P)(+)--arginine ADP-ribosyltransferase n=1 Tax=Rotaria magnacalcarata TaxID=392030 RepID=A0A816QKW3_9BILA|nr:unnamed protein product [Rotaria magnacalcarata]CAF3862720.1 unnamed protein product [Rotaria magnacalcarata]